MNIKELLQKIDKSMDDLDLISARRFIEENIDLLSKDRYLLKSNARALLDFLITKTDNPLNRSELNVINSVNIYASKFDVRGLKMLIKSHAELLMREDIKHYLNADAKVILEGMNAIHSEESGHS